MPQVQLPIFPSGSVEINNDLACRCEEENVVYYNGHLPVFMHERATKLYRLRSAAGFFVPGQRLEGTRLTDEKLEQAALVAHRNLKIRLFFDDSALVCFLPLLWMMKKISFTKGSKGSQRKPIFRFMTCRQKSQMLTTNTKHGSQRRKKERSDRDSFQRTP